MKAIKPILYGKEIVFSAKISAINPSKRILSISGIAIQSAGVCAEINMNVQATSDEWEGTISSDIKKLDRRSMYTLIVGATAPLQSLTKLYVNNASKLLLTYRNCKNGAQVLSAISGINQEHHALMQLDVSSPDYVGDFWTT